MTFARELLWMYYSWKYKRITSKGTKWIVLEAGFNSLEVGQLDEENLILTIKIKRTADWYRDELDRIAMKVMKYQPDDEEYESEEIGDGEE